MSESLRHGPEPDEDSARFWQGVKDHELQLQECERCGEIRFPPMPSCPNCGSSLFHFTEICPKGKVYSWIRVYRSIGSLTNDEIPCTFVVVELDVGCRMIGRFDSELSIAIDQRVEVSYVEWPDWTEVRFQPEVVSAL